jgi:hypothetical protein
VIARLHGTGAKPGATHITTRRLTEAACHASGLPGGPVKSRDGA